jgi:hypothetical protein
MGRVRPDSHQCSLPVLRPMADLPEYLEKTEFTAPGEGK